MQRSGQSAATMFGSAGTPVAAAEDRPLDAEGVHQRDGVDGDDGLLAVPNRVVRRRKRVVPYPRRYGTITR